MVSYEPIDVFTAQVPSLKINHKPENLIPITDNEVVKLMNDTMTIYKEIRSRLVSLGDIVKLEMDELHPSETDSIKQCRGLSNEILEQLKGQQTGYSQFQEKIDKATATVTTRDLFQINGLQRELFSYCVTWNATLTEILHRVLSCATKEQRAQKTAPIIILPHAALSPSTSPRHERSNSNRLSPERERGEASAPEATRDRRNSPEVSPNRSPQPRTADSVTVDPVPVAESLPEIPTLVITESTPVGSVTEETRSGDKTLAETPNKQQSSSSPRDDRSDRSSMELVKPPLVEKKKKTIDRKLVTPEFITSINAQPLHSYIANDDVYLLLPPGVDNVIVPVYINEPSSVIAHTLQSKQYAAELEKKGSSKLNNSSSSVQNSPNPNKDKETISYDILIQFNHQTVYEGKVSFSCEVHYAQQFSRLRHSCGLTDEIYTRTLARSKIFNAKGGKSRASFSKTQDDQFILKHINKVELDGLLEFAPQYFAYFAKVMHKQVPTALAKIFGVYTTQIKNQSQNFIVVMENLFYGKNIVRKFDLKGSLRSRRADTSVPDEVLLDQNLLEFMYEKPILVDQTSKALLGMSVWNDSLFLSTLNVMDYSLIVGIDANGTLVCGVIDYLRRYTWDKQLESWVKKTILGTKDKQAKIPTIVSPKQYQKRFRYAIWLYFIMVPTKQTLLLPTVSDPKAANENEPEERK